MDARDVTASLAAQDPPDQLEADYRNFIEGWQARALAVELSISEPLRFDPKSLRPQISAVKRRFRRFGTAEARIRSAAIPLGLHDCFAALEDRGGALLLLETSNNG